MSTQTSSSSAKAKILQKNDNDVVIVTALRSAMTKVSVEACARDFWEAFTKCNDIQGKKGGFKDTRPEEILSAVLRGAYEKVSLDPTLIEDIQVGNVLPPGGGATAARMAALHAGIPDTVPIATINRQCSSGLTAINTIANQISSGQIEIGVGACTPQVPVVSPV